ncbi:MAG: hypothetical protein MJ211_11750 [Bacteroidales bacterium]|nr:hypothetical protein [Bacteroidales bacterium]
MKKSVKLLLVSACLSAAVLNLTLNQVNNSDASLAFSDIEYLAYGQEGGEGSTTTGGGGGRTDYSFWFGKDKTIGQDPSDYYNPTNSSEYKSNGTTGSTSQKQQNDPNKKSVNTTTIPESQKTEYQKKYGAYEPLSNEVTVIGKRQTGSKVVNGVTQYSYQYDYARKCTGSYGNICYPGVAFGIPEYVDMAAMFGIK